MANKYWIPNGAIALSSIAANWNTLADGTGSTGALVAGDDVFIGHADTLAADIGNAPLKWDSAISLNTIQTFTDYRKTTTIEDNTTISFTAPSTITLSGESDDWASYGFRVGMLITTSGAVDAANNGTFEIATIVDDVLTIGTATLVTEVAGASVTVLNNLWIDLNATITLAQLSLSSHLKNTGSAIVITFAGTHISGERYILNFEGAEIDNQNLITYKIDGTLAGAKTHFDDGPHPIVTCVTATNFSPSYKVPSYSGFGSCDIYSLSLGATATFNSLASGLSTRNEVKKVFKLLTTSTLTLDLPIFDTGLSTWSFAANVSGFDFPVSGDTTNYGSTTFESMFYNVIIATPTVIGFKTTIPANRTLNVNSITVEADAVLEGEKVIGTGTTSTICSVRRPVVNGAWNFSQLADGVYVSLLNDAYPVTPSIGAAGAIQLSNANGAFTSTNLLAWDSAAAELIVDGKLTVTGLIDPTGMEFDAVAANPSSTNPTKTIWVNSADANKLYFGASEVGGGGGSGTVTSITAGTGLDGGTITAAGTIALLPAIDSAIIANTAKTGITASQANEIIANNAKVGITPTQANDIILNNAKVTNVSYTAAANGGVGLSGTAFSLDIDGMNATVNTPTSDDLLIMDDGANGTNRKITFTQVAGWIQNNVSVAHIRDARADGDISPNDFPEKAVSFIFTDDITGSPNSWDSVMTMKGWSDNYRVWQLWSSAASGSQPVDEVKLYFRSGEEDIQAGWGDTKEVLTFAGTAPNVDGLSGQVLQTNGAGVLSWATVSGGGGSYTDQMAINAVEAETDLQLTGQVTISDLGVADGAPSLLKLTSVGDNSRMICEADTLTKLPLIHLRDSNADANVNDTVFFALDRATPIVTGSARNDLLIVQGQAQKNIHFTTNNSTTIGQQTTAKMTIKYDGKVGIGTTAPAQALHVAGTIRQTAATNAVLVADGNGDIVAASVLADIPYLAAGQAETDTYTANPPDWAGAPPATIGEAINRIAAALAPLVGGQIP